jgi:TRAP-type mannitol/chloroaromatic compound transport system permease large subunit
VAPPEYNMMHIYRGIVPFVLLQLIGLVVISVLPGMTTWLPGVFFGQ